MHVTKLYDSGVSSRSYLLGEPLGKYHKIESIKTLNIYISAYKAIITSYMQLCDTNLEVPLISMNVIVNVSEISNFNLSQLGLF